MAKNETNVQGYVMDIAKVLEDKKAENVVMLNISNKTDFAEWFVLATALNTTHARALCDELEEKIPLLKGKVYKREGQGEWLVLDLGDVVVHVFTQEIRNLYHLEKLWSDGRNEFTLLGIEKARIKEQKRVEAEERKNQKAKEKEKQKKMKSAKGQPTKTAAEKAKEDGANVKKADVKVATKVKRTELKTKAPIKKDAPRKTEPKDEKKVTTKKAAPKKETKLVKEKTTPKKAASKATTKKVADKKPATKKAAPKAKSTKKA